MAMQSIAFCSVWRGIHHDFNASPFFVVTIMPAVRWATAEESRTRFKFSASERRVILRG